MTVSRAPLFIVGKCREVLRVQIEGKPKSCEVLKCAIAEHVWNEGHRVDRETVGVFDTCKYLYPRCLLESWHVHKQHHTINREHGALLSVD